MEKLSRSFRDCVYSVLADALGRVCEGLQTKMEERARNLVWVRDGVGIIAGWAYGDGWEDFFDTEMLRLGYETITARTDFGYSIVLVGEVQE